MLYHLSCPTVWFSPTIAVISTILQRYFDDISTMYYRRTVVEVSSSYSGRAGEGRPLALRMRLFARFCRLIALCYSVLRQNFTTGGAPALNFAHFAPWYPCSAPPRPLPGEKFFKIYHAANQRLAPRMKFFLKKYFGDLENGCIFASAFAEKRGLLKTQGESDSTLKRMRR